METHFTCYEIISSTRVLKIEKLKQIYSLSLSNKLMF